MYKEYITRVLCTSLQLHAYCIHAFDLIVSTTPMTFLSCRTEIDAMHFTSSQEVNIATVTTGDGIH